MEPEERFERIEALIEKQQLEIDKQNDGIRSLIVVARTCLDSIKEQREAHDADHKRAMAEIDKLREAQAATEDKLNILVDTVDKMIRHRNGGSQ